MENDKTELKPTKNSKRKTQNRRNILEGVPKIERPTCGLYGLPHFTI